MLIYYEIEDEGNQTVTNCNDLKIQAPDCKIRITDIAWVITNLQALPEWRLRENIKPMIPCDEIYV